MTRRTAIIASAIALVAVLAGVAMALRGGNPVMQTPTPSPNIQPANDAPLVPAVVGRVPERGEELRPDGALALVFNRAMDKASVEAALDVSPAVSGTMAWPDARTVVFTPDQALPRAAQYSLALSQGARAQDGVPLADALRFQFTTSGFLEVGQVIPADGAADVATTTTITVMFNRPVVPLTTVEQQRSLPQPLSFEPALAGSGEWLSTAIYVFTPSQPLGGGIRYTASVDAGLRDALANPMQNGYSWTFSTVRPQVLAISPQDGATGVSVEPSLSVQFNQPVAPDAGQAATLSGPDGATVPVRATVAGDTLTITPTQRLAFDTNYQLELAAGLGGVGGGQGLAQSFTTSFRTAPLPKIVRTEPADGAQDVQPSASFSIVFNAPIDPKTVMPNLVFTPELSATQVYTYYDEFNNTFAVGLGERPSTDFRVQIGPNIADIFGNTTGQSLDVRFRTAPLPASSYLVSQGIGTYSAGRPSRLGLMTTNTDSAALRLYRLPADTAQTALYRLYERIPDGATLLREWTVALDAPLNTGTLNQIDLLENNGALDAGMYVVELVSAVNGNQRQVMIVSPLNLTIKAALGEALVWANDMQTGAPVPNVVFDIYEEGEQARLLGSATTDGDGLARLKLERSQENGLIAVSREPFALMGTNWATSMNRWEFQTGGEFYAPGLYAYVDTDRPIYRPGQQVHLKGIIRDENDARFTLPQSARAQVSVRDANGETLFDQVLTASQTGAFTADITLPEGAALGDYQITTQLGDRAFTASFTVAAYRPPEFTVALNTPQQTALRGQPTSATVDVAYLFGGPVANVPVTWTVLAEPYRVAPDWAGRYTFGTGGGMGRCWECWWTPPTPPLPVLNGSGTSDENGKLTVALPATLLDGLPATDGQSSADDRQPYTLTIEAVATGRDNQAIAGRTSLVMHPAELYVGLASQNYLGTAGREQAIDVVTTTTDGVALPNGRVELAFQRVTWQSTLVDDAQGQRWETSEQIDALGGQTITTDSSAQAVAAFTPDRGGSYRVVATVRDSGGRTTSTTLTFWVAGTDYVPWMRDNSERITLVADKASYAPGETATILIPSPFQGEHWALITVERAGVRSVEVRRVAQNSIIFQLPITADDAPNLYISAVLFQGEGASSRGLAEFKIGTLPITVEPTAQQLDITLTPSAPQAEPGTTVAYEVQVRDSAGQPVAAELSLDLVDKGVLSLAPRQANDILATLYARRGLGVTTSSGVTISGDRTLEQAQAASGRGGAVGGGDAAIPVAESAPMSGAPASDSASNKSSQQAGPSVRENFADTAYWNPVVTTDANGQARIEIALPDNLTTWVLRGVGITSATQVGEGTVELVATKPLLIRPVTPRFFTVGDVAELAANVSNNTDAPLEAQVALAATGLSVSEPLTQTVSIPARSEANVTWTATAQDVVAADLVFSVQAGELADASRPRLATAPGGGIPVYRYSAPEIVGTGGELVQAGSRSEVVVLPPKLDERGGELTVRLDASLAAPLRDSLDYLEYYEYECAEQTVSRFLPNILTARALRDLGVPNTDLEARLPGLVNAGIGKLATLQNDDGGWGWWQGSESNPQITAYAVFGLAQAQQLGNTLPADLLARAQAYLATQLVPTGNANERANITAADANQQAFILFALAESGRGDQAKAGELFEIRAKLAIDAHAFLLMTLHAGGANADDARIKALLADLNSAAILSSTGAHWEEGERDWWSMGTNTRSTAIVLEALSRIDPANQLNPNIVRWLMVARSNGVWATTQENAWGVMALTSYMASTGELRGEYDYGVLLNRTPQLAGRVTPADLQTPIMLRVNVADLLRDAENVLTIGRGEGAGRLYYSVHLRAFLPVEELTALDRGVIVRRRYVLASCTDGAACPDVREVKLGDVLRVELSIVAPGDLHYLVVEDPLPAGFEAIDPALATTSILESRSVGFSEELDAPRAASTFLPPWYAWYSRVELRDQKVALFADRLPRGAYLFSYTMRATLAGEYRAIPTTASEMYFPDVYGRGDGAVITVK